jgi:hypothetical protein
MGLLTTLDDSYAISLRRDRPFRNLMDHEHSTPATQTQVRLRGSRVAPRLGVWLARWRCSPKGKAVPFPRFCLLRGETQESVVGTVSERYGFIWTPISLAFSRSSGTSAINRGIRLVTSLAVNNATCYCSCLCRMPRRFVNFKDSLSDCQVDALRVETVHLGVNSHA